MPVVQRISRADRLDLYWTHAFRDYFQYEARCGYGMDMVRVLEAVRGSRSISTARKQLKGGASVCCYGLW